MQPTHFLEVVKSYTKQGLINYPVSPIEKLAKNLQQTESYLTLKTFAVWKIKVKPQPLLITGDNVNGVDVLIAEKI